MHHKCLTMKMDLEIIRLEQYNEKQKNTVYENYGKITANISSENIDEKTLKK